MWGLHLRRIGARLHHLKRAGEQRVAWLPGVEGKRPAPPLHARQGEWMAKPGQPGHGRTRVEFVRKRPVAGDDARRQPELAHELIGHRLGRRGASTGGERAAPPAVLGTQGGLAPDHRLGDGQWRWLWEGAARGRRSRRYLLASVACSRRWAP